MRAFNSSTRVMAGALLVLAFLPLTWSLGHAVLAGLDGKAWLALGRDGQTVRSLCMSAWTGLASTALAIASTAGLLSLCIEPAQQQRLTPPLAFMLAVPHAAFAMGLVLLIAPSGWLLRLFSPWATGLSAPPPWPTTQDPWGLGLISLLALKETPFLLWAALTHLQRPEVSQRLGREWQLATTLGYAPQTAWWRVVWPQVLSRMGAPLLAVLAYGLTVVDVALVIGPTSPPTLAVLSWQHYGPRQPDFRQRSQNHLCDAFGSGCSRQGNSGEAQSHLGEGLAEVEDRDPDQDVGTRFLIISDETRLDPDFSRSGPQKKNASGHSL